MIIMIKKQFKNHIIIFTTIFSDVVKIIYFLPYSVFDSLPIWLNLVIFFLTKNLYFLQTSSFVLALILKLNRQPHNFPPIIP